MNIVFAWKDGKHFKLKVMPNGKKSRIECIKKNAIQYKLEDFQKKGWHIQLRRPENIKY